MKSQLPGLHAFSISLRTRIAIFNQDYQRLGARTEALLFRIHVNWGRKWPVVRSTLRFSKGEDNVDTGTIAVWKSN